MRAVRETVISCQFSVSEFGEEKDKTNAESSEDAEFAEKRKSKRVFTTEDTESTE